MSIEKYRGNLENAAYRAIRINLQLINYVYTWCVLELVTE